MVCGCRQPEKERTDTEGKIKNVVVIISDDHSYETLGCYGNEHIKTPNMDKLAEQGVRFTSAYSQSPICAPSRQSIQSAKYPHATGVSLVFTPFPDHGNITIAEVLKGKDYATCLIGKNHFNNGLWHELYKDGLPDHGYDQIIDIHRYREWLQDAGMPDIPADIATRYSDKALHKNPEYLPQAVYDSFAAGTYYARQAIGFMEKNREKPFFLWLGFNEPHAPFNFPVEFAGTYDPEEMPLGQKGPEDERWVPEKFRDLTGEERRGIVASYYTSVTYMDRNMGRVVDYIDGNELAENTLVIYVGDQGYLLNDHGRFEKHMFWNESVRAPLIIRGPGIPEGVTAEAVTGLIDLGPTIMDVLGYEGGADWQGQSFLPVLTGEKENYQQYVFSTFHHDNKAMVASKKWKYVFHTGHHDLDLNYRTGYGPSGIFHRLYDLEEDPGEMQNLAYEEEYLDTLKHFRDVMLKYFRETHPLADEVPEELNKLGRLVWFCEPRDAGSSYGPPRPVRIRDSLRIDIFD